MDAIRFFIKTLIVVFVAIALMQVKIGERTIEEHFLGFVHHSSVTTPLHEVADGATRAIRTGWNTVTKWVNKNRPTVGERASSLLKFERSEEYRTEQERKASKYRNDD